MPISSDNPQNESGSSRSRNTNINGNTVGLLSLPREVLGLIAEHIYDPLILTQQDRLTWGIFSTVDMSVSRTEALSSLVNFGWTCRRIRKEVRVVLFRCIRTSSIGWVKDVIKHKHDWGGYVKSIIIDLNMFDQPEDQLPRSCWRESALLISLLQSLPHLEHLSFFADQSDDSTLALLFATMIPHPSSHPIPDPLPFTPSASRIQTPSISRTITPPPTNVSLINVTVPPVPFAARIKSFGWRQRSKPPQGYHEFSTASTFVSTLHLLRHAHRLGYLVLDADMDMIRPSDLVVILKELYRRKYPHGETASSYSLILCGPIRGWEREGKEVLEMIAQESGGSVCELFIDRPLVKSTTKYIIDTETFLDLLSPLHGLPSLRLLQVGSYTFAPAVQVEIAKTIAQFLPNLNVLGLNGQDNDTTWWGIWRDGNRHSDAGGAGGGSGDKDVRVLPLSEGDLRILEDTRKRGRSDSGSPEAVVETLADEKVTISAPLSGVDPVA